MNRWRKGFRVDPLTPLLTRCGEPLRTLVRGVLLERPFRTGDLWGLPDARRILGKQKANGSWEYPAPKERVRSPGNYDQMETFRNLGFLVEEFGFNREHPAIRKAAEFLFSFQTREGDLRGIYGRQTSPNYTAAIIELLVKAGFGKDPRVKRVFDWFLAIRQRDGGWALPFRTRGYKVAVISTQTRTIPPDLSKPSSFMVTGVVLRAFAAHPAYRRSKEARQAGELLLSGLFKRDRYPDRPGAGYWLGFSFPFWYTDLVSALDSLSQIGFSRKEPRVKSALEWFVKKQRKDGLWEFRILKGKNKDVLGLWLSFAVCRIFKRFQGKGPGDHLPIRERRPGPRRSPGDVRTSSPRGPR